MRKFFEKYFKLWFVGIPIILIASFFQVVADLNDQGRLNSQLLVDKVYPMARSLNGAMTNLKFRLRGEEAHKQKIIILAADDESIAQLGRFPWNRNAYAEIIESTFQLKAKAMALDMALPESENHVPDVVIEHLSKARLSPELLDEVKSLNSDSRLASVIKAHKSQLVLGFTPVGFCFPKLEASNKDICPVGNTDAEQSISESIGKFALPIDVSAPFTHTPMIYYLTVLANIPMFRDAASFYGSFQVIPDPDGFIRRYPLVGVSGKQVYPSLALQLAEIASGLPIDIEFTDDQRVKRIRLGTENEIKIPATPLGYLDLNFHANKDEKLNYTRVSAIDLIKSVRANDGRYNELFKDSVVLFGATAIGIYDMRAFPFNSQSPGVEGHAAALDNILSQDALKSLSSINLEWLPLLVLWILGIFFAIVFGYLEAVPSIIAFAGFILITGGVDLLLFKKYINYPSAFLLAEVFVIFVILQSIRYILEEKNKKFIKLAFSHYLAPQVVDYVLKDPSKLEIGGERRELSVLFTDIRGFTTLSEKMEPKELSNFLNEYLTAMTNVIFEYGGTLDKYIGDAVMAFWGAPIFREDHAYQAAIASLQMQKKMDELQVHFKEKYNAELSMGVGINSGIVSVGNMGSSKIFDYTVIGDHVNLASRLEGLNRIYGTGVLCSNYTLEAIPENLRSKVYYRVLDSVKVKGKKNAIDIIELSLDPVNEASYALFKKGRELFRTQNWDDAKKLFEDSNVNYSKVYAKSDSVCELFIERCEKFKLDPPADNWDGSIEMREK